MMIASQIKFAEWRKIANRTRSSRRDADRRDGDDDDAAVGPVLAERGPVFRAR